MNIFAAIKSFFVKPSKTSSIENPILTKSCANCNEIKSLEDFHKDPHRKDGRDHRCKNCRNANRRVPKNNPIKIKQDGRRKPRSKETKLKQSIAMKAIWARKKAKKTCTKCKETHQVTYFNKNKQSPDGYAYYCKTCTRQKDKNYIRRKREEKLPITSTQNVVTRTGRGFPILHPKQVLSALAVYGD